MTGERRIGKFRVSFDLLEAVLSAPLDPEDVLEVIGVIQPVPGIRHFEVVVKSNRLYPIMDYSELPIVTAKVGMA